MAGAYGDTPFGQTVPPEVAKGRDQHQNKLESFGFFKRKREPGDVPCVPGPIEVNDPEVARCKAERVALQAQREQDAAARAAAEPRKGPGRPRRCVR